MYWDVLEKYPPYKCIRAPTVANMILKRSLKFAPSVETPNIAAKSVNGKIGMNINIIVVK